MITGYTRPLYLLPFDHRASYISGLFGWKEPLNVEQMVAVANSKQVIYAGFQQAIAESARKYHERSYAYYRCVGSDAYRFGGVRLCWNKQLRTDLVDEAVWEEVC